MLQSRPEFFGAPSIYVFIDRGNMLLQFLFVRRHTGTVFIAV